MDRDRASTEAISILRNVLASPTIIRSSANSAESNVSPSAQLQSETESELRTLFRPSTPGVHSIAVHESLVGLEQFNCLLFFRKIPQLLNILWFSNIFCIFEHFPTVTV